MDDQKIGGLIMWVIGGVYLLLVFTSIFFAWARAEGIAQLAAANIVPSVSTDVLWYHATYVAPSWGHRLNVAQKIGAHIFYRA